MEVHFPGFRGSPQGSGKRQRIRVKYNPWTWELAAKVVYSCGAGWAIKSLEPYKAPVTDGIYPILLQEGPGILLGPLTKDFGGSIALRYVPPVWRATK